jgi:hypothetical protein
VTLATIEIDFDIHKMIESERRSFTEPHYMALRRLLKLPDIEPGSAKEQTRAPEGRSWRDGLVELPHGTLARMAYDRGKQVFQGEFLDGKLVVNGQSFDALSEAASELARTKAGTKTSLNGWIYWEAKLPGESKWRRLSDIRDEARRKLRIKL